MKRMTNRVELAVLVAALLALAACSGGAEAPVYDPSGGGGQAAGGSGQPTGTARTLAIPGQEVPQGQPPAGQGAMVVSWDVPADWTAVPPASSMRKAQYRVPGPGGDGECAVFFFGVGQGGDPMANAERWAGQFTQPDGRSSQDVMQMEQLQAGEIQVLMVEVTGTYNGGMTMTGEPARALENHMLLVGMTTPPTAAWFFKFTGPEATVRAQREAFRAMMESIRPGG